jgi:hypothetical protein
MLSLSFSRAAISGVLEGWTGEESAEQAPSSPPPLEIDLYELLLEIFEEQLKLGENWERLT